MTWSVYILQCSDDSLYTGCTNNLDKRLEAHNTGNGAKYTRSRRPCSIIYSERHGTKNAALKREYEIKKWTRKKKLALIEGD